MTDINGVPQDGNVARYNGEDVTCISRDLPEILEGPESLDNSIHHEHNSIKDNPIKYDQGHKAWCKILFLLLKYIKVNYKNKHSVFRFVFFLL